MKLSSCKGVCNPFEPYEDRKTRVGKIVEAMHSDDDIDLDAPTGYSKYKDIQPVFRAQDIKHYSRGIPLP